MNDLFQETQPPLSHKSSPAGSAFDKFWDTVPKKIGKHAAQTAWKKLKPAERTEALKSAEGWYKWWRRETLKRHGYTHLRI